MKTIGGYENRDGMEQYNRDTVVKVITDKHFFTKKLNQCEFIGIKSWKKSYLQKRPHSFIKTNNFNERRLYSSRRVQTNEIY